MSTLGYPSLLSSFPWMDSWSIPHKASIPQTAAIRSNLSSSLGFAESYNTFLVGWFHIPAETPPNSLSPTRLGTHIGMDKTELTRLSLSLPFPLISIYLYTLYMRVRAWFSQVEWLNVKWQISATYISFRRVPRQSNIQYWTTLWPSSLSMRCSWAEILR